MRIGDRHLDDVEALPEGADLPVEQMEDPWYGICVDWFEATAAEQWDDLLLPPAAATIYGLPMPEQMPRPGQVAGWTHREWIGWAVAHGFEEVPRSKHAYQYRHRLAPALLLSMSSSPGDFRWSMATATDLRFAVDAMIKKLAANLYIAVQIVAANVERHPSGGARERLRLLRRELLAASDRETALRWVAEHGDLTWDRFDLVEPDAEAVGAIRAAVAALQKDFDLSPRAALRRLGYGQDEAALLAKRLSSSTVSDLLPGDLVEHLEELVDRLREERASEEAAKEALRAARPADAPVPAVEAASAVDPMALARQDLRKRLETLRAAAAEAAQAYDRALTGTIAAVEGMVLAPTEEVERLRQENAELRARLDAAPQPAPLRRRGRPPGSKNKAPPCPPG